MLIPGWSYSWLAVLFKFIQPRPYCYQLASIYFKLQPSCFFWGFKIISCFFCEYTQWIIAHCISGTIQATASSKEAECRRGSGGCQVTHYERKQRMVQDKMVGMTGKVILPKGLSNLCSKMKAGKARNDLEVAVKLLKRKHGKYLLQYLILSGCSLVI